MRESLPPREREVFDAVLKNPDATVAEVLEGLDGAPSASAVRTMLNRLVGKRLICSTHRESGITFRVRFENKDIVKESLQSVTEVFFGGSHLAAANALLGMAGPLTSKEMRELEELVGQIQNEGKAQ